jgi:putative ABC transport system substrate-binding protein
MIDRRAFLMALLAAPMSAEAQIHRFRIGWLVFGSVPVGALDQIMIDGLAQRGFIDGRNIEVIFRYANATPSRLVDLADELVAQKPDLLVGIGGDIVKALFDASKGAIPIVGGVSDNPVRAGLATTLARPGKNFTGITFITDEMAAKRMELLREVAPGTKQVAVIWNPQHLDDEFVFAQRAAQQLGISVNSHRVTSLAEVDATLRAASAAGADSLFVIPSRLTSTAAGKIALYAREQRLPVVCAWREFVDSGCLLSYGPSRAFELRRLAGYAERILGGVKPEDLPVEQPTRFELVINLKTAKAIDLAIPAALLARADEVIE